MRRELTKRQIRLACGAPPLGIESATICTE
jgi:hypothetical protein